MLSRLGVLGLIAYLILRRVREHQRLRRRFAGRHGDWMQQVANAHQRWADHYLEREEILGLEGVTGQTQALWVSTTKAVDDLLIRIKAMEEHGASCAKIAAEGSIFRLGPYRTALARLSEMISFDTKVINEDDLFGTETHVIHVHPDQFAKESAELFKQAKGGWGRLQDAARARASSARSDFPHSRLDSMFKLCGDEGIPTKYLQRHPLYGDDASDQDFYDTLDKVRRTDPLAYMDQIEKVLRDEQCLSQQLLVLRQVLSDAKRSRVEQVPAFEGRLHAEDDPESTIGHARVAETKLEAAVASLNHDRVVAASQEVVALYSKVTDQAYAAMDAAKTAESSMQGVRDLVEAARSKVRIARKMVDDARGEHRAAGHAVTLSIQSRASLDEAEGSLHRARTLIGNRYYLDAKRESQRAAKLLQVSMRSADAALRHLEVLEGQRKAYEDKVKRMHSIRSRWQYRASRLGRYSTTLDEFRALELNHEQPQDYVKLMHVLDSQEVAWRNQYKRAKSVYDEDQRQKRLESERREAAERAAREAARRRRSSYSSTYSSSSSGSYGGGGFGGSSGSFGGGGFGGSSGGY